MNNKLIISLIILASTSVSMIMCTDTGDVIQITNSFTDETPYGCNRNLTLTCNFKTNRTAIVWMTSNDIRKIAECRLLQHKCSLNADYVGQYDISADVTGGIFNLTIMHVTKQHSGRKLVCTDGSNSDSHVISVRGADVAILQTSSTDDWNPHECGKSLTLDCVFTRKAVSVVWMNANNRTRIAICSQNNCSLNPQYTDKYDISFDMRWCIFSLTIRMVTKKDDGRKMICTDGPNNDYYIINVRNYAPRLYEDTNALTATSGCVSREMNVLLKWIKINADSGIEKEINPKFRDNNTRTCSNQSMCGNDHEIQYTETIAVNPGKGNCFLKVLATYDDKPLESPATVKKYTIEDSDCKSENSVNVRTQSTNVKVTVVVVVVFVIVVLFVSPVVVCLLKRFANFLNHYIWKRSKQPCKQAGFTDDICIENGIPPTDEKQKLLSNPTVQGNNLRDECLSQGQEDMSEKNVASENETSSPNLDNVQDTPDNRTKMCSSASVVTNIGIHSIQNMPENDKRKNLSPELHTDTFRHKYPDVSNNGEKDDIIAFKRTATGSFTCTFAPVYDKEARGSRNLTANRCLSHLPPLIENNEKGDEVSEVSDHKEQCVHVNHKDKNVSSNGLDVTYPLNDDNTGDRSNDNTSADEDTEISIRKDRNVQTNEVELHIKESTERNRHENPDVFEDDDKEENIDACESGGIDYHSGRKVLKYGDEEENMPLANTPTAFNNVRMCTELKKENKLQSQHIEEFTLKDDGKMPMKNKIFNGLESK